MPYPYRIKSRLIDLRKTQNRDLIPALREREIKIDPSLLSNYLTGVREGKNADMVLTACNEIVTAWEKETR